MFAIGVFLLVAISLSPFKRSSAVTEVPVFHDESGDPLFSPKQQSMDSSDPPIVGNAERSTDQTVEWQVQPGDTLTRIFREHKAPVDDLQEILEADAEYLSLETLTPGTRLGLSFDDEDRFSGLTLHLDPARKVVYTRQKDGSFVHKETEADTYWVSEVLRGTVNGSFYQSALRAGLTRAQVVLIDQLLGSKLDFGKDLRAGDSFTMILGHEMTGEQSTGNTRIEAISLVRRSRTHYAFRFDDGNYYDENGESVTPAFLRWPTKKRFRVSSAFNRNRLHPVTGRRAPHNGVDLATPVGTPIVSTGDGIVRRIGDHPYAGKYVDIDHGGAHTTRYLHLHRILVKKGAQIKRGQQIALSGNTGRSTGPHLHFEFHVNDRPVDPLKADIPTAAAINEDDTPQFEEQLGEQLAVMEHAGSRSELMTAEAPSLFN
ncbi:peptidoglycan DD-metalloendopeptidase family protein [Marinobacter sp.]|uniref:peptidoglycan DD-metalloendopeptidase family protein n=1 Tax=Marinobacter sp. TaxID=50741 RepID=UPI003563CFF4